MDNNIPWTGGPDEEYETQHFGFGAQKFKIAIRQMIEQNITRGLQEFDTHLNGVLNLNDTDKATLQVSFKKLTKLFNERAKPSLQIIDAEINKMINIPPNVYLPEDEIQIDQYTDEEYRNLMEEVNELKKRIDRSNLMNTLLTAEEQNLSSVLSTSCVTLKNEMEVFDLLYKREVSLESLTKINNKFNFRPSTSGADRTVPATTNTVEEKYEDKELYLDV